MKSLLKPKVEIKICQNQWSTELPIEYCPGCETLPWPTSITLKPVPSKGEN